MASPLRYRPEIDGLRALAVLPVILFHAGFTAFSGGFIGVDVFFVISGYLITTILLDDLAQGRFSLLHFYERRARRILPALFVVMFATLPFAYFWLWPGDLKEYSRSLKHVSIFLSNHFFYHKSDYFDTAAAFKPLLHTWSLAIEEQYYVFFPPLLWLIFKYARRFLPHALWIIALSSLTFAHHTVQQNPGAAYFLLPSRIWELMVGSLLAYYQQQRRLPVQPHAAMGFTGIALILYAIFRFDETLPYPSLYTLVPTLGAAFIIAGATTENAAGKLLARRPFVFLGLISYSAYLWHQPLFAFARLHGYAEAGLGFFAILCIITFALAYLTWRYVETPFRKSGLFRRKQIFLCSAIGIAFFISMGEYGVRKDGFVRYFSEKEKAVYAYMDYDHFTPWRNGRCLLTPEQTYTDFARECYDYGAPSTILWGDSFAAAFAAGLRQLKPHVTQLTTNRCPPILNFAVSQRPACIAINRYVFDEILRHPPRTLILSANWMFYQQQNPAPQLAETLKILRSKLPHTHIYVIGNLPQWWPSLPDVVLRHGLGLNDADTLKNAGLPKITVYDAELRAATESADVTFLSAIDQQCRDGRCQVTTRITGKPELITWDYGHPTVAGSLWILQQWLQHELKN